MEYVNLYRKGARTVRKRRDLLISERARLKAKMKELSQVLDRLDYKIKMYDTKILSCERELLAGKE